MQTTYRAPVPKMLMIRNKSQTATGPASSAHVQEKAGGSNGTLQAWDWWIRKWWLTQEQRAQ